MALWGNNDSVSVSGTVTITQNSDGLTGNVVGSSTSFDTTTKVGNYLVAGGNTYIVTTIGNSTFMTIKSGKNGVNVVAQSGGTSYNIQQGPASVGVAESSDHAATGQPIMGNAELVYGVDSTEMGVSNASIVAFTVINPGSGYFSNASVTVGGNGTANAQANASGKIGAVNVVLSGNSYTAAPTVTIAAPAAQAFNANTALIKDATFNANTGVANATDFITTASAHGFTDGDLVQYLTSTGNTALSGLTNASSYYVVSSNTTALKLATTAGGANINITASSVSETGHTLRRVGQGYITISSNKFANGDYVTYLVAAGNTALTGLTNAASYYVVLANSTVLALSTSRGGPAITLTPGVGETGHTLTGETATAAAVLSGAKQGAAHAGWVRRVVGTGGRAGRIQEETLVAMGSITGDFEDTVMKDA
ncbi:hypothetical protein EBT25_13825 [bacterium]|nr:hypothetical protein [bacterium]